MRPFGCNLTAKAILAYETSIQHNDSMRQEIERISDIARAIFIKSRLNNVDFPSIPKELDDLLYPPEQTERDDLIRMHAINEADDSDMEAIVAIFTELCDFCIKVEQLQREVDDELILMSPLAYLRNLPVCLSEWGDSHSRADKDPRWAAVVKWGNLTERAGDLDRWMEESLELTGRTERLLRGNEVVSGKWDSKQWELRRRKVAGCYIVKGRE